MKQWQIAIGNALANRQRQYGHSAVHNMHHAHQSCGASLLQEHHPPTRWNLPHRLEAYLHCLVRSRISSWRIVFNMLQVGACNDVSNRGSRRGVYSSMSWCRTVGQLLLPPQPALAVAACIWETDIPLALAQGLCHRPGGARPGTLNIKAFGLIA